MVNEYIIKIYRNPEEKIMNDIYGLPIPRGFSFPIESKNFKRAVRKARRKLEKKGFLNEESLWNAIVINPKTMEKVNLEKKLEKKFPAQALIQLFT